MKRKYYWKIVPTIANEEICSFNFEVVRRRFFFKDKVEYTGFYIFNRHLEIVASNVNDFGSLPLKERLEHIVQGAEYNSVERMCAFHAEMIFDQFK